MKYNRFLECYRFYTRGNETPELFHLWCGLSALAGACEKRLWLDRGFFNVYFNLYVVLISPAGLCAKSSSLDLAGKLLKDAGYRLLEGSVLKEKIIIEMLESMKTVQLDVESIFPHCSVTYLSDELNVLLSSGVDMIKFLVDMYSKDDLYAYKTKNSGTFELPYPYFNLLTAAVPQWFGPQLAGDMASTGFLARCILIYLDQKRGKYPQPIYTKEQVDARAECLEMLTSIADWYGPLELSESAKKFYDDWYMSQDISPSEDYRIAAYLERRNKVHILKVAGLMAVGDLRKIIQKIDFERAIDLFKMTEKRLRMSYLIAGGNKLAQYVYKIQGLLKDNGGKLYTKDLMKMFYTDLNPADFKICLQTLVEMNEIELVQEKSTKLYYINKLKGEN
ncbi:MAG TPA: hypothetical protein PLQ68_04505 [Clostridia bacterium]|nr:hypothetical protein [Clostridia bacterium]